MADPRLYDGPAAAEQMEATGTLRALLDSVPGADVPYSESHNNPHLVSSPAALLEMATIDPQIREQHGLTALVGALVRVVAERDRRDEERDRRDEERDRRIGELEARLSESPKPAKSKG